MIKKLMKHRKYSGSILKSATSGAHLSTRLNINAKYSSNDLIGWQKSLIKFKKILGYWILVVETETAIFFYFSKTIFKWQLNKY